MLSRNFSKISGPMVRRGTSNQLQSTFHIEMTSMTCNKEMTLIAYVRIRMVLMKRLITKSESANSRASRLTSPAKLVRPFVKVLKSSVFTFEFRHSSWSGGGRPALAGRIDDHPRGVCQKAPLSLNAHSPATAQVHPG